MAYELPPLPYDYNALEPHIDEETMHLHHDKHHQAYVNNLNAALQGQSQFENMNIDDLMRNLNSVPDSISRLFSMSLPKATVSALGIFSCSLM